MKLSFLTIISKMLIWALVSLSSVSSYSFNLNQSELQLAFKHALTGSCKKEGLVSSKSATNTSAIDSLRKRLLDKLQMPKRTTHEADDLLFAMDDVDTPIKRAMSFDQLWKPTLDDEKFSLRIDHSELDELKNSSVLTSPIEISSKSSSTDQVGVNDDFTKGDEVNLDRVESTCKVIKSSLLLESCPEPQTKEDYAQHEYGLCQAIKTVISNKHCSTLSHPTYFPPGTKGKRVLKQQTNLDSNSPTDYIKVIEQTDEFKHRGIKFSVRSCQAIKSGLNPKSSCLSQGFFSRIDQDKESLIESEYEQGLCSVIKSLKHEEYSLLHQFSFKSLNNLFQNNSFRDEFISWEEKRRAEEKALALKEYQQQYKEGEELRHFVKTIIAATMAPPEQQIQKFREAVAGHDLIFRWIMDGELDIDHIREQAGLPALPSSYHFLKTTMSFWKPLKDIVGGVMFLGPVMSAGKLFVNPTAAITDVAYGVAKGAIVKEAFTQFDHYMTKICDEIKGYSYEDRLEILKWVGDDWFKMAITQIDSSINDFKLTDFEEVEDFITKLKDPRSGFDLSSLTDESRVLLETVLGDEYFSRIPMVRKKNAIMSYLELSIQASEIEIISVVVNDLLGILAKKAIQQFGNSVTEPRAMAVFAQMKSDVKPIPTSIAKNLIYKALGSGRYKKLFWINSIQHYPKKYKSIKGMSIGTLLTWYPASLNIHNDETDEEIPLNSYDETLSKELGEYITERDSTLLSKTVEDIHMGEYPSNSNYSYYEKLSTIIGEFEFERYFSGMSENPIASATVGVVYLANKRKSGERIVVKVLRPGLAEEAYEEADQLKKMLDKLVITNPHGPVTQDKVKSIKVIIDQLRDSAIDELNLIEEVKQSEYGKRYMAVDSDFKAVTIDVDFPITPNVMFQKMARGLGLNKFTGEKKFKHLYGRYKMIGKFIGLYVYAALSPILTVDNSLLGYLHGDLHAGNLFYEPIDITDEDEEEIFLSNPKSNSHLESYEEEDEFADSILAPSDLSKSSDIDQQMGWDYPAMEKEHGHIHIIDWGNAHKLNGDIQSGIITLIFGVTYNLSSMVDNAIAKFHKFESDIASQKLKRDLREQIEAVLEAEGIPASKKLNDILSYAMDAQVILPTELINFSRSLQMLKDQFYELSVLLDRVDPDKILPRIDTEAVQESYVKRMLWEQAIGDSPKIIQPWKWKKFNPLGLGLLLKFCYYGAKNKIYNIPFRQYFSSTLSYLNPWTYLYPAKKVYEDEDVKLFQCEDKPNEALLDLINQLDAKDGHN